MGEPLQPGMRTSRHMCQHRLPWRPCPASEAGDLHHRTIHSTTHVFGNSVPRFGGGMAIPPPPKCFPLEQRVMKHGILLNTLLLWAANMKLAPGGK